VEIVNTRLIRITLRALLVILFLVKDGHFDTSIISDESEQWYHDRKIRRFLMHIVPVKNLLLDAIRGDGIRRRLGI